MNSPLLTKRAFVSSYLLWRMEDGRAGADDVDPSDRLDEFIAWEAIYHAAQEEPYFHATGPSVYDDASAEQIDRVRRLLAARGISGWWDTPLARNDQRRVVLPRDEAAEAPRGPFAYLRTRMRTARTSAGGGIWWTPPIGPDIVVTSRSMHAAPAVALVGEEDEFGDKVASVLQASPIGSEVRVYEVSSVTDWVALVDGAPADVTRSRRETWGSFDESAKWFIPDWTEIAESYDAVHLTVDAYLDLSALPVPCARGYTMLVGWGPDQTVWLKEPPVRWSDPLAAVRTGAARWTYVQ